MLNSSPTFIVGVLHLGYSSKIAALMERISQFTLMETLGWYKQMETSTSTIRIHKLQPKSTVVLLMSELAEMVQLGQLIVTPVMLAVEKFGDTMLTMLVAGKKLVDEL
jgi:hypothetical protein